MSKSLNGMSNIILQMPNVLSGKKSIVGYFSSDNNVGNTNIFRGKPGITGLIHIQNKVNLTLEEKEQFDLYYAKNQTLFLDLEIIVKSLQQWLQK